jgi:uroporphyrinogen decarboxylase
MKSRERVERAVNCKEADKTPVDFGGTIVTCLDLKAHKNLKKYLGIDDGDDPVIDYTMGTVEPCEAIMRRFGSDVRRVGMNVIPPKIVDGVYEGGFGIRYKKAEPHEYFDVCYSPLAGTEDLGKLKMPDPDIPELYCGLKDRARDLYENSNYAVFADFGVPGFYETSQKIRGYENLACDLLINREFLSALYDRLLDLQKRWFNNYLEQVGGYAVAIGYADDLGMQDRPQMSPETYREVLKPYHKKIFSFIHEKADVKIMLHSCGAIEPLMEDLIDAGVDIFNPLQTRAAGMSPEALMAKYRGRAAFWGGMDEQQVLPHGTKEEITAEVKRLMGVMGRSGYVFGPGHNVQEDTPPTNIITMFEAAEEYRQAMPLSF